MAIFLDSVDPDEAAAAADLGFVDGITTNPSLIASVKRAPYDVIRDLVAAGSGIVFHQLAVADATDMEREADRLLAIAPERVALKVPCTLQGARLVHRMHAQAVCAVTAVYTEAQAYLFAQAGARYVIPYVNRAERQGLNALGLIGQLAKGAAAAETKCEVLAASLKTPEEAAMAVIAGARHVTLPWSVLAKLAYHPLTEQALSEFTAAALAPRG